MWQTFERYECKISHKYKKTWKFEKIERFQERDCEMWNKINLYPWLQNQSYLSPEIFPLLTFSWILSPVVSFTEYWRSKDYVGPSGCFILHPVFLLYKKRRKAIINKLHSNNFVRRSLVIIVVYGKITPPIYHSIKSSHVQWPMSQVATCDRGGVTS